jgi:hypothetical protein
MELPRLRGTPPPCRRVPADAAARLLAPGSALTKGATHPFSRALDARLVGARRYSLVPQLARGCWLFQVLGCEQPSVRGRQAVECAMKPRGVRRPGISIRDDACRVRALNGCPQFVRLKISSVRKTAPTSSFFSATIDQRISGRASDQSVDASRNGTALDQTTTAFVDGLPCFISTYAIAGHQASNRALLDRLVNIFPFYWTSVIRSSPSIHLAGVLWSLTGSTR